MRTVHSPSELRALLRAWRDAGESLALVPTMGDLHAGHLALVDEARRRADRVVASIFVNPLQFGPGEDFAHYPRMLETDRKQLVEHGADVLFAPSVEALYPDGTEGGLEIRLPGLDDILCGAERPGHFAGVAKVVAKLFNIVAPQTAVFGEKDYQQLLIIRRLARELDFPVRVTGVATVREADGLALSSRNRYLTETERAVAPLLYQTLCEMADALRQGDARHDVLCSDAFHRLGQHGFHPGYVRIRRADDLGEPQPSDPPATLRVLAAAHLGRARLIDNVAVAGEGA